MSTPAQAVVVGISQPVQQQGGQIVTSLSQISRALSGAGATNQAIVTVSGVLPQTTSTLTRQAGGQIVVSQVGKSAVVAGQPGGTLQVAGRSLTPIQIQQLKNQAIIKR